MKEFGSDFHTIDNYPGKPDFIKKFNGIYLADGRMAIQCLINSNKWKRIWIPQYFCYEVLDFIKRNDIEVCLYPDYPGADDTKIISKLKFKENDVILRINYFGLRGYRTNSNLNVTVIEDHTHGLHTEWAINSDANYCIASLRKTIPIPEGGILWSPLQHNLPTPAASSYENNILTLERHYAMYRKKMYLSNFDPDKKLFRQKFIETENTFGQLQLCQMSKLNASLLMTFNARKFDHIKKSNWAYLTTLLKPSIDYLKPENSECIPFALILVFNTESELHSVRSYLIKNNVYPAILWSIPASSKIPSMKFYLTVHCDGRYSKADIKILSTIINNAYSN